MGLLNITNSFGDSPDEFDISTSVFSSALVITSFANTPHKHTVSETLAFNPPQRSRFHAPFVDLHEEHRIIVECTLRWNVLLRHCSVSMTKPTEVFRRGHTLLLYPALLYNVSNTLPMLARKLTHSLGVRWTKLPASTPTPISTRATKMPSRIEIMAETSANPTHREAINHIFKRTSHIASQAGAKQKTPTMTRSHSRSYQSTKRTVKGELHRLEYNHYITPPGSKDVEVPARQ